MQNRLLPFQGWRLTLLQGIMFGVFLFFALRMYDFQVMNYPEFQAAADENRLNELPIASMRGVIFDRYNKPLAINAPAFNVEVVPASLPDDTMQVLEIYNRLSALVDVPPTVAVARASGQKLKSIEELVAEGRGIAPFRAVTIAQDVDFHVALQLKEEAQSLPGVSVTPVSVREYPSGALTSHIIGYMGPIGPEEAEKLIEQGYNPSFDRVGYWGIELFLESILAGKRGSRLREVDVAGAEINEIRYTAPVPGQNIRLTIDVELQKAAEEALKKQIALLNSTTGKLVSQQGVVIALNPQNGQILALVSYPSYDNSRFARAIDVEYYEDVFSDPLKPLVNNAIQSLYAPGSVFKIITSTGVLQEDVIRPDSVLYDAGRLQLENKYAPNDPAAAQTFYCWKRDGHQEVWLTRAIAQSCNVYFYQVGGGNPNVSSQVLRSGGLGINDLFRYSTMLGIGSELGIELPGENAGRMPDPDWKRILYGQNWSTGDTYNAALGQGYVTVTPLQLITAVSAVVNNGIVYQPTLIESFLDPEGNVLQPFTPHVARNVTLDSANGGLLHLQLVEDMILKGENSLACTCEADSPYYKAALCDPANYRSTVDVDPDPYLTEMREYTVNVPLNYVFNGSVCNANRWDANYQPPFVDPANLAIIRQGMRGTVTVGTAMPANLPYVMVAGKTGTAEYCDNIAWALGECKFGSWPAHAWFAAYAPYENPEVLMLGFIYHGMEGSKWAVPVVVETLEAYYRLKSQREGLPLPGAGAEEPEIAPPVVPGAEVTTEPPVTGG
ncbi:MAG TPA: penicillin-binding transpeptidase domain-containing protein [Phototrophicaceae bacterium]|nr:penicillin-binding transpeptidase domain-containing protein [Phototrophicaceae bacterium]